jgi:phosphatidylglycerol---prolipoprotein diacylglyceryl transferase
MQFPHIDPVFLRLGPLEFRWYGLMYILSFLAAYFVIRAAVKRKGLPLSADDAADLVFTVAMGIIIGGRCGYMLFYNFPYYLANPLKIFAVWEGGMSFHGGLAGAILAGVYYARKKKTPFLHLADVCFQTAPIGLFLGRLGNFINGELYGRVTDVPWGVVFPGGGGLPRHPSQLYEAFLEGPALFVLLWLIGQKERPPGVVLWSFIALYGSFRFVVEFFREPDSQLGYVFNGLSMGQMLCFPMMAIGVFMIFLAYRQKRRDDN